MRQDVLELHERGWGAAHRHQWNASLSTYVYPRIGDLPVRDIDQAAIMQLIEPLWSVKTTTASRVRSRIEAILDYALAHKFRQGDNPARILAALPKPSKIAKAEHFCRAAVGRNAGLRATASWTENHGGAMFGIFDLHWREIG
jgi:hypothetical protein